MNNDKFITKAKVGIQMNNEYKCCSNENKGIAI